MNAFDAGFFERVAALGPDTVKRAALRVALDKRAAQFSAFPNPSMAARNFYASFMNRVRSTAGTRDPQIAKFAPIHRNMIAQAVAKREAGAT